MYEDINITNVLQGRHGPGIDGDGTGSCLALGNEWSVPAGVGTGARRAGEGWDEGHGRCGMWWCGGSVAQARRWSNETSADGRKSAGVSSPGTAL